MLSTGNGSRTIHTDYSVELFPEAASGLTSQYKIVTVTAYWDAPPAPVKPVVLQTIVYRQYAGPPIVEFSTDPVVDAAGVLGGSNLASVTLSARVDLSAGATPASLQFKVAAYGGETIASQLVTVGDLSPSAGFWYDGDGTFYWKWDCSTAANTVYDLQATAFSVDKYAGNTPHLYPRIDHILPPAPPDSITATQGDASVGVVWALSTAADLASYELFRSTSATGPWDSSTLIATVQEPATSYTDTGLANGTTYYYAVRAVTTDNRRSAAAVSNAVTPDRLLRRDAAWRADHAHRQQRGCGRDDHSLVGCGYRPVAELRDRLLRGLAKR